VKYIIAIIRPDKLGSVVGALREEEIELTTVSEVAGCDSVKPAPTDSIATLDAQSLPRRIKIEIAVSNSRVWQAVDAIARGAYSGAAGDGKVFVLEMTECIRVRTGETGVGALA